MAKLVVMPKLGLTMTEGTLSAWKKKEGDAVKEGEPLFDVETDKLTNTIDAPASGILRRIILAEGQTAECLAPVAIIAEADEDISGLLPAQEDAAAPTEAGTPAAVQISATAEPSGAPAARVIASPVAKKLAKELGIDVALVTGTGPRGRITEEDVRNYKAAEPAVKASPLAAKVAADIGLDLADLGGQGRILAEDILKYLESSREKTSEEVREETVPMNGMRRAIAKNMLNSHLTSPTVTLNLSVDMSEMKLYREQLKKYDIKVSYTDLLVKFTAKALTEFPLLNCSVEDNKIIYKRYVNMGVAVALDDGLVVPNITDADKKSLTQISAEVTELAKLAREGGLSMDQLRGGTFTITNLGAYGIESFTPIINQPEVAILGVTTIEDRAVVRNGEIVIRPMMTFSLTADHRVIDGAVAASFLQRLKNLMENPALMLA
jgi:pyruvate dehydrogenase E2 component (dihydrolipoamide acetyltransferase)